LNASANKSVRSNEIDLKILREMGVKVPSREKYERKLTPKNKFRAGVFVVMAAMRLSKGEEEWAAWKGVGEKLKLASVESAKRAADTKTKERAVSGNEGRPRVRSSRGGVEI
jgi:hypothetical protein